MSVLIQPWASPHTINAEQSTSDQAVQLISEQPDRCWAEAYYPNDIVRPFFDYFDMSMEDEPHDTYLQVIRECWIERIIRMTTKSATSWTSLGTA